MTSCGSVAEALSHHYAQSGLPPDGGRSAGRWSLRLGPLHLGLDNFEWRRRALQLHDVHHLLTGYRCTPSGEMEMAAWEFAAGRFRHPCATLFCLPLVGFGALLIPRRSFAAFRRGRDSRTLYGMPLAPGLMALPIEVLRQRLLPSQPSPLTLRRAIEYAGLVGVSLLLTITPFTILFLLFLAQG